MQQQARRWEPRWISVSERLPAQGQLVRYRTKSFSTAGHCNKEGKWTDSRGKPEIAEVLDWMDDPK
jgi:hypothetical protein